MKNLMVVFSVIIISCSSGEKKEATIELPPVPQTPVRLVSDTLYGKAVEDPYRYLEDLKHPDVEKWYKDHSERSRFVLDAITGRKDVIDKMYEFDKRKANRSGKPVLFLPDFEAGHGIGDTKSKHIEVLSDVLTFALWQTGHPDFTISKLSVKGEKPESNIKVQE